MVVNVIKEMAGRSGFDDVMVSCFEIRTQVRWLYDLLDSCMNLQVCLCPHCNSLPACRARLPYCL